ncbi:dienelactone hydrolase family protein [Actinophytocola sediminis]
MHVISQSTTDGVLERRFTLGEIPGVCWSPAGATTPRPLVLLCHGGGQHKTAPPVLAHAQHLTTVHGLVTAAIDVPGAGDRPMPDECARLLATARERMAAGESPAAAIAPFNTAVAARAVPEWQSALTALHQLDEVDETAPVGYWGVSLGTAVGVPLLAAEARIGAAVLGLAAHEHLSAYADKVTVPVLFLLQWDDELVPRSSALALFDAFSSPEKTLHANPGGHRAVPTAELEHAGRFLAGRT